MRLNRKIYHTISRFEGKNISNKYFEAYLNKLIEEDFTVINDHFKILIYDERNDTFNKISIEHIDNNTICVWQ